MRDHARGGGGGWGVGSERRRAESEGGETHSRVSGIGSDGIADASRHLRLETEPSSAAARFAYHLK